MKRDLIHPEFPFTEEEHAAAWILLGMPAAEAQESSKQLRSELSEQQASTDNRDAGWLGVGPPVEMTLGFSAVIHLAADIHAAGSVLSATARDAWLIEWSERVSKAEAERRLDQLALLGTSGLFLN